MSDKALKQGKLLIFKVNIPIWHTHTHLIKHFIVIGKCNCCSVFVNSSLFLKDLIKDSYLSIFSSPCFTGFAGELECFHY